MQNIFIIALSFITGVLLRYVDLRGINIAKILNTLIIYLSLPSLILLKIPTVKISNDTDIVLVLPWVLTIISAIFILLLSKRYKLKREEIGSLLLVGVLGNTSFLGVPLIDLFFGKDYVSYALLYDQLGSFIILSTYGSVIVSIFSKHITFSIKSVLKRILTFPPFITLVLSLLIRGVKYDDTILFWLETLSYTLVPFALLSVGYQLRLKVPKNERTALFIAIFTKTVFAPLVALFICLIFTDMSMVAKVAILEAGMGPMITASIMANLAGLAPRVTNAIVGYGILVSFITLPIFYYVSSYF